MTSPYLDTREAAIYLRFTRHETGEPDRTAAREWLASRGVPFKKRGRIVLYRVEDIEAVLETRGDAR